MAIEVKICEMHWFYEDQFTFIDFVELLQEMPSSVYCSDFVQYLLDQNWEQ